MKLLLIYRQRWWLFYLPVLIGAAVVLWWSANYWKALPPERLVLIAGATAANHIALARRYADRLERVGISPEISLSPLDSEVLERMVSSATPGTAAFAESGEPTGGLRVQGLAAVAREPVWIFSRSRAISLAQQAEKLRVAAGLGTQSTVRSIASSVLQNAGVKPTDIEFLPLEGVKAANALLDGKIDLVFDAASHESEEVRLLLRDAGVQLVNVERSSALTVRNPHLRALLLPQGTIELRGDIPPNDITLISQQTHLLARTDMHPAMQRALLDAAQELHEFPGFLQDHGEFPSFTDIDFPLSPVARAYSHGDRPWLETVLPYRTAQGTELLLFAVLPIFVFTLLLLSWIPRLFDWRVSAALNHFYGELKFLESEIDQVASTQPIFLRGLLDRLDQIERQVVSLDLPDEFSDRWYTLREHLAAARERLLKLRAR